MKNPELFNCEILSEYGVSIAQKEYKTLWHTGGFMTNRVTLAGSEVSVVDGLIFLVTGDKKGLHGEFWLEPDEQVVVIRYPKSDA